MTDTQITNIDVATLCRVMGVIQYPDNLPAATNPRLVLFIAESNRIENINRAPTLDEIAAHEYILALDEVTVADLEAFVEVVAPGHKLRTQPGMNVRVDDHLAPRGGPGIGWRLENLLTCAQGGEVLRRWHPHRVHVAYETLHPFTNGNGRSGRVLWLHGMKACGELDRALDLGFLRLFYYQTLALSRT